MSNEEDDNKKDKKEDIVDGKLNIPDNPNIGSIELQKTMRSAYLDYAMSVIVGRALPDVKDGLKPVHRRVIYAMFDGGYRPDKGYFKCTRVIGEVMGKYHPHGDTAIYDTLARLTQDWSLRYPLVDGQGNFGSPGDDGPAAPRYTECRMEKLAMEMVRDIDQDTVDFRENYDGRQFEPVVLPAKFPNLLVNGAEGIAVGMATKIPSHNLKEISDGVMWHLEHPDATDDELLENLLKIITGPDFPTAAYIVGRKGIEDAYRTGRGSIILRAVCDIEEVGSKQQIVVKQLPYQVSPDELARRIGSLADDGTIKGISAVTDYSSGRTGQRLVIKLKKDAVPKVVLNNLYKHTRLQDSFPCNMVALVDGVPKRLKLHEFIKHWTAHQIDVIVRRTKYRLKEAEKRAHILRGLLKALDALDEVIALIRKSPSADDARVGLMKLLDIDDIQANAILELQLRRLAALERQKIIDEAASIEAAIRKYNEIINSPQLQRDIVKEELTRIVEKFGDDRKTVIIPDDASIEDEAAFIKEEDVVITITKTGLIKSTPLSDYRAQKRGGKGLKGGNLKTDDIVEHFFITSTHNWLQFWTNKGRVYRLKAYQIPRTDRVSRGKHINNLLTLLPDEHVTQILNFKNYTDEKYIVLATKKGLVKKSELKLYDSNRTGGIIGITLADDDELVSAHTAGPESHILVVSKKGSAIHFVADEKTLRSTGRSSRGNIGIRFRDDDSLLAMDTIDDFENTFVFTMTANGFAKRTKIGEYTIHGRGGKGMKVAKPAEKAGDFVGAFTVKETDEVMIIMNSGKVLRSNVSEVRSTSRATVGVRFAKPDDGDFVIGVTKNAEKDNELEE